MKKTTYPGPIQSSHRNSKSGIPHRGPSDDFTDCNIVLNDDLAQKLHAFSTALAQDSETDFGVQWTLLSGPTGARGGLAGDILSDLKSSVSKYPLISPSNRVTKIIRNAFDEAVHVSAHTTSPQICQLTNASEICRLQQKSRTLRWKWKRIRNRSLTRRLRRDGGTV